MLRTLGLVTLSGNAQPVLGDALTAAITAVDQNLGVTITVASTAWYQIGDRIVADPLQLNQDTYRITQILSSTQMVGMLEGIAGHTHNSGALLQLAIACGNVVLQNLSAADVVVVGADNTITTGFGGKSCFVIEPFTAPEQPNDWQLNPNGGFNTCNTSEGWMIGTSGQTVLAYAWVF